MAQASFDPETYALPAVHWLGIGTWYIRFYTTLVYTTWYIMLCITFEYSNCYIMLYRYHIGIWKLMLYTTLVYGNWYIRLYTTLVYSTRYILLYTVLLCASPVWVVWARCRQIVAVSRFDPCWCRRFDGDQTLQDVVWVVNYGYTPHTGHTARLVVCSIYHSPTTYTCHHL